MDNNLERSINFSSILKFTFPSMIMMLIMSLYTIIDGVFVSRLIGTDAFSAVNIVFPAMSANIGLGTMFGTGIVAIVSRKIGEGKKKEANEEFTFIAIVSFIIGLVFSLVCTLFIEDVIYLLGANDEIYDYCYDYALPLFLFFAAEIPQILFQNMYVADGKPHIGLIVTIIGGITNAVLDYVFIAIFDMGIAGAAIATGLGFLVPAIFGLVYFLTNKNGQVMFVKPKMRWKIFLFTVTNGSSEMVTNLSISITTFLFNIIMMHFAGQDGVAAISILLYLDFILIALNLGYSMGVAPLFSFNYGKRDKLKIKKLFNISIFLSLFSGVIVTILSIIFAKELSGVFSEEGSHVYNMAVEGMRIYAISYIFKGVNVFASAMFTAFENGKISAILSFMRTLFLLSVLIIVMAYLFGVFGIWIATPLAEAIAMIMAIYFIYKYKNLYGYI